MQELVLNKESKKEPWFQRETKGFLTLQSCSELQTNDNSQEMKAQISDDNCLNAGPVVCADDNKSGCLTAPTEISGSSASLDYRPGFSISQNIEPQSLIYPNVDSKGSALHRNVPGNSTTRSNEVSTLLENKPQTSTA
ncbi:MAG: hypothetical protein VXY56_02810, partial [Pseudomonadota bacterium]|nr:hypothetical protein [Pseudomonadota bacterium]